MRYIVFGFYSLESPIMRTECETMDEVHYEVDYLNSENYRVAILDSDESVDKVDL